TGEESTSFKLLWPRADPCGKTEVPTITTGLSLKGCSADESHSSALFKDEGTECCCSGVEINTASASATFLAKLATAAGSSTPSLNIGRSLTSPNSISYLSVKCFLIKFSRSRL